MMMKAMPLFWLSCAFLAGIALGTGAEMSIGGWIIAGLLALLALLIEKRNPNIHWLIPFRRICSVPLGLLLAVMCMGAIRAVINQLDSTSSLSSVSNGSPVTMQGSIAGMPEQAGARTRLMVDVVSPVEGRLMLYVSRNGDWEFGDRVDFTGVIIPIEPGNSLAWRGVQGVMYYPQVDYVGSQPGGLMDVLYRIRLRANDLLMVYFPQPEAGFLSGILLGISDHLTEDLYQAFRQTGTSHILVISGFNMALVAGLVAMLLQRLLPARKAAPLTVITITLYTLLTGATPPVVRAALMAGLSVLAATAGRRNTGINTLAFTAAVMCVFNPLLLVNASFQLSFTATLGLVLLADPLQKWFGGWLEKRLPIGTAKRITAPIAEYFLFTLAAQLISAPVLLYWFGRIPLIAFLANPLLLPVQPAVMILGGLAVLIGLVWAPLGQIAAWIAWPLTAYTTHMTLLLARLPAGWMQIENMTVWGAAGLYGLIGAAYYAWQHRWAWLKPALALGFTALAVAGLARSALAAPVGYLRLTAWQGGTVLVQTPNGNSLLINGDGLESVEGELPTRLGGQQLAAVMISPASAEDLTILADIVDETTLGQAWWLGTAAEGSSAQYLQSILVEAGSLPAELQAGDTLQLDSGITLKVLCVTEEGAALWLEFGGLSVLIPDGLPRTFIRLPGHTPDLVITSFETADEWQDLPMFNPPWDGWSIAISNGSELWLE
ncbi:MAG TPA: ComEC/Rec2 family competence protein, partial [Longilinea sp.]|nr:ComEC/Rec2 family competence protein [Longilinea sp.]